jgi:hypothetical protein
MRGNVTDDGGIIQRFMEATHIKLGVAKMVDLWTGKGDGSFRDAYYAYLDHLCTCAHCADHPANLCKQGLSLLILTQPGMIDPLSTHGADGRTNV